MSQPATPTRAGRQRLRPAAGFGLVELMVAMALGLLVVGGAVALLLSTRQANGSTDNLSRMAESVRTSHDLITRELREAGTTPCDAQQQVANVLGNGQGSSPTWWAAWGEAVRGYTGSLTFPAAATGTATAERVAGTAAVLLRAGSALDALTVTAHNTATLTFSTSVANHGLAVGDLVMVCDFRQAAVLQVTAVNLASGSFSHTTGSGSPGNCSSGLGLPVACSPASASVYQFPAGALVGRFNVVGWYIGNNGRSDSGGRSLFRATRLGAEEVADGVRDLQLRFLVSGATDYVAADSVADWSAVTALRLDLTFEGPDANTSTAGSGARLTRGVGFTINLRNMQP